MAAYTPKTGAKCACKRGIERDNCPRCEGTGLVIDFAAIHAAREARNACGCGSGLAREAHHDARGIFLCYACAECEQEKLSHYRSDVLTDPDYWADEPIEPED
jgi:hypothetical protein